MTRARGARTPHVLAGVALAVALCLTAIPAAAQQTAPNATSQTGWRVEQLSDPSTGAPSWRITWAPPGGVVVRALPAVITSDGRPVGTGREDAALTSLSVVTDDPRLVLGNPRFAVTYGGVEGDGRPATSDEGPERAPGAPRARPPAPPYLSVDPGVPGRFSTRRRAYDLGPSALRLPALEDPVELAGEITWPVGARGRRPVVVFLHGRHATCYRKQQTHLSWPCPKGWSAVPSHAGYRRAADVLASHGHVVISISANGVNAFDGDERDFGALARGQLVLAHLQQWKRWSTRSNGPFGTAFVGRLDLGNVGLMGHSRGGEGVVQAALRNRALGSPFGIKAVMPVAPTNTERLSLPAVPMSVVLPYCDGDVFQLSGQRFYDDARYGMSGDPASRSVVTVMGANHNYFNAEWTPGTAVSPAVDDWHAYWRFGAGRNLACHRHDERRLSASQQRAVGTAYIAGFFRLHLGGEDALVGLFDGSGQRARSAGRAVVRVVGQSPRRVDLDRFEKPDAPRRVRGLTARVCAGAPTPWPPTERLPLCVSQLQGAQVPQWDVSGNAPATPQLRALDLRWDEPGGSVRLPLSGSASDLSRMHALTFRAASAPSGGGADLAVQLTDRSGRSRSVRVSEVSRALNPPAGQDHPLPHLLLQQVHLPLTRFRGVDLRRLASVTLVAVSPRGRLFLADLAAQRPAAGSAAITRLPTLSMRDVRVREGHAGPRSARFTVTASHAIDRPITVHVQVSHLDGPGELPPTSRRGRVTIPAGARQATFDYPFTPNRVFDTTVELVVTMTRPRNAVVAKPAARGEILDDDPEPTLTLGDAIATESDEFLLFPMRLSAPSGAPTYVFAVTEAGTAVPGEDYADVYGADGEIPAGRTHGVIRVPLVDDDLPEPTKEMYLRPAVAAGRVGAAAKLTGTILDDD